jgi:HK97 family phage major capsid protein
MNIKALLKRKTFLVEGMKEILSNAEKNNSGILSAEEQKDFEDKKTELEKVKSQIELINGVDLSDEEPGAKTQVVSDPKGIVSPGSVNLKKEFESCNEFLSAVLAGGNDSRLEFAEYRSEQRMDTGSKGGFLVPAQFRNEILMSEAEASLIRPRAQVIPAGNPPDAEIKIPALEQDADDDGIGRIFGGVEVSKVAEGGTKPITTFDVKMISLQPHEMAARIPLTDKLMRNWTAAGSWATKLLSGAIAQFSDVQFIRGNGVGGPDGILDAASSYEVARAVSMQVGFADLKNMLARFRGNSANAVWACSYGVFGQLLSLTGDGGGATNIISVNQATGSVSIYGIPVVRHSRMRALGSKGDIALIDASEYLIKDGSGPIVEVGYATGNWEANKKSIKVTFNVDGRSWRNALYTDEAGYESSTVVVLGLPSGS